MPKIALALSLVVLLISCAAPTAVPNAAVNDLAPGGKVRAAINFGNPILATKDAASGDARGVSVDLARELARRLGVPVELVTFTTAGQVVDALKAGRVDVGFDVAAGVKQQLEADAKRLPGLRLLEGRFMVINQAMGTPRGRAAGAQYLTDFVVTMKASGFVAQALARHGIEGVTVAP